MPISLSSLSHLHHTPLRPIFLSLLRLHLPPFILILSSILLNSLPLSPSSALSPVHPPLLYISSFTTPLSFLVLHSLPPSPSSALAPAHPSPPSISSFIAPLSYVLLHSLLLSLLPPPPSSALSPARPPPPSPIPLPSVFIVLIVAGGVIQGNCLGPNAGLAFIITKRSSHPTAL